MIKNHKKKAIIASVIILLPILFGLIFWNQLPDTMVRHWGADGVADGTAPKAVMVFAMPLVFLGLQWLLLWLASVLEKDNPQNSKITAICLGIVPAISVVVHIFIYSIALEKEWNLVALIPLFLGIMFVVIGNYLPKTTRNRTTGIKLPWTMGNDENWNKTHRLGGKLMFWGGFALMATALLPFKISIVAMVLLIAVNLIVPTVYSYSIYKKHKAENIVYEPVFNKKSDKVAIWITAIAVPLILLGTAVLMFTGDIQINFGDTQLEIVATYGNDLTVSYAEIESVEYRESFDCGMREMGFASAKLSMGTFKNAEFGRYTLYAYAQGKGAVVLKKGNSVLVLVGKTAEETKQMYDTLISKAP